MNRLLIGYATLALFSGTAMAGAPKSLSDIQMDEVTAAGTVTISGVLFINSPAVTVIIGAVTVPPPPGTTVPVIVSSPGYTYPSSSVPGYTYPTSPFVVNTPSITVTVGP